jgi:hypothetical protein
VITTPDVVFRALEIKSAMRKRQYTDELKKEDVFSFQKGNRENTSLV